MEGHTGVHFHKQCPPGRGGGSDATYPTEIKHSTRAMHKRVLMA